MMKLTVSAIVVSVVAQLFTTATARCQTERGINPGVPWPAKDALGREMPLAGTVGPAKPERFVGIFYFLWHDQRRRKSPHWNGPYDVSRILARDPDALSKPESDLWGPSGTYHYWGEPLFGYYLSKDPWVLRRHAMLLTDAGIDTLIFDATNAVTYSDVYRALCEVFREMREQGNSTPQFAFMLNTRAGQTAERIYRDLYQPGHYRELWFHWQGKPLMICDPDQVSDEVTQFFTLRRAHWPFTMVNTPYAWHWEATYPQVYGYTDDPEQPEQVNVSVAQNLRQSDGRVTNMSDGNARGRSFHGGRMDPTPGAIDCGHNFQEQWRRALELDPPFVLVTGWNEWIAGRWRRPGQPLVFVDQLDQEFSRDIEPVKGAHGDNYYWQLIANVRRYKGAVPLPAASAAKSICIEGSFRQWDDVHPEFRDHVGETALRESPGAAGLHYTNRTGRNDLVAAKVARDGDFVYFHVRTADPISTATDPHWMWLLIDIDRDPTTGWEGYEFLVNRAVESGQATWLERSTGGWHWEEVAPVTFRAESNQMHLAIPRAALDLREEDGDLSFDFKWLDNAQRPGNILDSHTSGDAAPEGRFRYRYTTSGN